MPKKGNHRGVTVFSSIALAIPTTVKTSLGPLTIRRTALMGDSHQITGKLYRTVGCVRTQYAKFFSHVLDVPKVRQVTLSTANPMTCSAAIPFTVIAPSEGSVRRCSLC